MTGTDGLASEHPARACPSSHSPYPHPKRARALSLTREARRR